MSRLEIFFDEPELFKVIPPSIKHHVDLIVKTGTDQSGVPIHITPLMGPELTFYVRLADTIENPKAKIQDKRDLPLDRQCLKVLQVPTLPDILYRKS